MCLLAPNGGSCTCPAHLALKDDGKTCHFGKQCEIMERECFISRPR